MEHMLKAIDLYNEELKFGKRREYGERLEENWQYIEHRIETQRFLDEAPEPESIAEKELREALARGET